MKMAKNRLTRNSFKRKIIVFGVAIFMSVAMMATGFAAWVISSNAQKDASVTVETTTITNGAVGIELEAINGTLCFGPQATDKSGYLKISSNEEGAEKLFVEVKGTVTNFEYLDTLTVEIDLSAIAAAIDNGYVKLADELNASLKPETTHVYVVDLAEAENINFKFELAWGAKFNYDNPGIYFDNGYTPEEGSDIVTDIEKALNDLNTALGTSSVIKLTFIAESNV